VTAGLSTGVCALLVPAELHAAGASPGRIGLDFAAAGVLFAVGSALTATAGRRAVGATFGPYAASKFALTAFNESLRAEVTLAGIRVAIIEPGATATEIHEHIKDEKVREFTRNHVEKDGAMQADDVAAAVVFVVSLPPRVNVSQLVIRPTVDARVL